MSQSTTALDEPAPAIGSVFDSVLGAYRADGFDAGYHRAVNDLLADFALVAREFIREQGQDSPQLLQALREFQDRFEKHLENAAPGGADQFVDGGLGI
jgi:hypothetical protein